MKQKLSFIILLITMIIGVQASGFFATSFWQMAGLVSLGSFSITGVTNSDDSSVDAWLTSGTDATVNFSSSTAATSYDVSIKDASGTTTLCSVAGATSTAVSLPNCNLVDRTTYLIHITAKLNSSTRSASNNGFSFTVDTSYPTTNTITGITGSSDTTADAWLVGGLSPQVNWNAFTGAANYDVTIRDAAGTGTICALQNTTSTSLNFSSCALTDGTSYRAYVTAKSPSGARSTDASNNGFSFTVDNTAPGAFTVSGITGGSDAVVDASLTNGTSPTVHFTTATSAYRYDVVIKDSTGTTTICSANHQATSPVAVTCALSGNTIYTAFVTAKSISTGLTTAATNTGYSFTVGTVAPAVSPSNFSITGATGGTDAIADGILSSGVIVTANWQPASGAQNYSATIRNAGDTADVCSTQVSATTSYTFTGCTLSVGVNYLIKVVANNSPAASVPALNNGFAFQVVPVSPGSFAITGITGGSDSTADEFLMAGTTVTANWATSSNATSYDVTIRNDADTADICATENTTAVTYTISSCPLTAGTSYRLKVVAKVGSQTTVAYNSPFAFSVAANLGFCPTGNTTAKAGTIYDSGGAGANYSNSENCNFTIAPTVAPAQITLSFASFASSDNGDTLTIYDGSSTAGANLGAFKNTTTTPTDKIASSGRMYFTWVSGASNNAAGYSMSYKATYAKVGTFSITGVRGGTDVTADSLLSDQSSGVTAVWTASSGATSYDVSIRDSSNSTDVCTSANTASTTYTFNSCTLMMGSKYFVTVLAKNATGSILAATNSPFSFTYTNRPLAFAITGLTGGSDSVADSTLENTLVPTLNWTASTNQTSYEAVIYESDGTTVKCPRATTAAGATSHTFSSCTLTVNVNYYAEVIAKNANGSVGPTNNPFSFKTVPMIWSALSLNSSPTARYNHTAVWTGSEMIIWGGTSGSYLNSGARYNPTTDAWTPTGTGTNVPAGRHSHIAQWTGSSMVIWGGLTTSSSSTNTGGRYTPGNDSWLPTSVGTNVPVHRYLHTSVWTGSEVVVWGGMSFAGFSSYPPRVGGRYNPTTDSWLPTSIGPNAPQARSAATGVWTGTEMIVWGGGSPTGGRYNPTTDTWAEAPNLSFYGPGDDHFACWTGSEMIVWGTVSAGSTNSGGRYNPTTDSWVPTSTNIPVNLSSPNPVWADTEMIVILPDGLGGAKYNPSNDTWTAISTTNAVPNKTYMTVVWTGTEVLAWGGWDAANAYTNAGSRYNPSTNTWSPMATLNAPSGRRFGGVVWTGTEAIFWGGADATASVNTGGRYNPSTDSWATMATGPAAREYHVAVWTGTEMIIWAGTNNRSTTGIDDGWRYNPANNTWTSMSTTNAPVTGIYGKGVWTGSEMVVFGGEGNIYGTMFSSTGGRYNPATNSWSALVTGTNVPAGRYRHTAVWTGTEMIVWGGRTMINSAAYYQANGARWNLSANSWSAMSSRPANMPASRSGHTAIWTGTEMIVWGGSVGNSVTTNTGGKYNPATDTWTETSVGANVASSRELSAAIWTGTEMIIWGGQDGNPATYLSTGSKYNPATNSWTAMPSSANAPSARSRATMIWTDTRALIWGGYNGSYLGTGSSYTP